MAWLNSSKTGDYIRVCDVCGERWLRSKLKKRFGKLECPRHNKERPRQELDRINAAARPVILPATPDRNGGISDPSYQYEEASLFHYLVNQPYTYHDRLNIYTASHYDRTKKIATTLGAGGFLLIRPSGEFNVAIDGKEGPGPGHPSEAFGEDYGESAAECARYCRDIIIENQRPVTWITSAKRKLREMADWLLERQFGSAQGLDALYRNSTTADMYYGFATDMEVPSNFTGSLSPSTYLCAQQGLTLIWAYECLGDTKYLLGARRCAWPLRRLQCGDKLTSNFSQHPTGVRKHFGAFAQAFNVTMAAPTLINSFTHTFRFIDIIAMEFCNKLKTLDADSTYGDAAAAGSFASATSATLSTMISECRTFWTDGAPDGLTATSNTAPLTSSAIRHRYTTSPTGNGTWTNLTSGGGPSSLTYPTVDVCAGLRSFFNVDGFGAVVEAAHSYIGTTENNPAQQLTYAGGIGAEVGQTKTYTFDGRIGVSSSINTSHQNGNDFYATMSFGLLADLTARVYPDTFRNLKRILSEPSMRWTLYNGIFTDHVRASRQAPGGDARTYYDMALDFAPVWDGSFERYPVDAAAIGRIYRVKPRSINEVSR